MGNTDDYAKALTTTTTSARHTGLTFAALKKTIDALGPPPEKPKHYMRLGDVIVPIQEFEIQNVKPTLGIDEAHGPDRSMLTIWQREQLKATLELKPAWCGFGVAMDGHILSPGGDSGKFIPFTLQEVRRMRKHMRTKSGKETLKTIRQTPALCQQDPRKLRRLARRLAKRQYRLTGERATWHVYKHGTTEIKYTNATPVIVAKVKEKL